MAIDLNTLTSPATSGDVLAEALTTADFLEGCPVLRNLSRGSQKGGDAKQTVSTQQPKALPLDANGKGYCYLPVTTGNAPAVTFPAIGSSDDFVLEMDVYLVSGTNLHFVSGANGDHRLAIYNGSFYIGGFNVSLSSPLALGVSNIKIERTSGTITLKQNDAVIASRASSSALTFTHLSFNGQFGTSIVPLNGYIQTCTLSIGGTEQLNIDFTATNVRHGDTKFKCATGQVVTVNQSGNDPSTIIKKPVLRFANKSDDSTNISLAGLFNQTITDGYMFAAFSVLGDGGEGNGRVFSVDNGNDNSVQGGIFSLGATNNLRSYYRGGLEIDHIGLFDDALGNVLHDVKLTTGSQVSKVNNADQKTATSTGSLSCVNFNISSRHDFDKNAAIDLEYLALFPASITDAEADSVRNYINNRNNVFSLIDSKGFYFFDPQKATFTGNFTNFGGGNILDGYITGSDNGDTDVRSNLTLIQETENDQPSTDGYTITFNDNAEFLEFKNGVSQTLAGWQIVGTSLGTFAYRVNNNAVAELNLLGNAGGTSYRQSGNLYGVILLPDSASSADIESARRLLIDRGAADGVSGSSLNQFFRGRTDILEFNFVNTAGVTDMSRAWQDAGLTKFALLDTSSVTNLNSAFANCNLASFPLIDCSSITQMGFAFYDNNFNDFPAIQAPLCSNFSGAWQNCSALQQFPSGAKLGTAANNVNFTAAWKSSGITSFPALDLSNGSSFSEAWAYGNLTSFSSGAKLGTNSTNVNFSSAWISNDFTSFSTPLPTATILVNAFRQCTSLTSFDLDEIPLATNCQTAWALDTALTSFSTKLPKCGFFNAAWYNCSALTDFSADVFSEWNPSSIESLGVFNNAWDGCTALTAQSVENILTSINASGQYATTNGASGGTALADAGIDIDYNVATGSLSAATNSAVTSLKSKGWSIFINSVEQ